MEIQKKTTQQNCIIFAGMCVRHHSARFRMQPERGARQKRR